MRIYLALLCVWSVWSMGNYLLRVWQGCEPDLACHTIITQSQFDFYFPYHRWPRHAISPQHTFPSSTKSRFVLRMSQLKCRREVRMSARCRLSVWNCVTVFNRKITTFVHFTGIRKRVYLKPINSVYCATPSCMNVVEEQQDGRRRKKIEWHTSVIFFASFSNAKHDARLSFLEATVVRDSLIFGCEKCYPHWRNDASFFSFKRIIILHVHFTFPRAILMACLRFWGTRRICKFYFFLIGY